MTQWTISWTDENIISSRTNMHSMKLLIMTMMILVFLSGAVIVWQANNLRVLIKPKPTFAPTTVCSTTAMTLSKILIGLGSAMMFMALTIILMPRMVFKSVVQQIENMITISTFVIVIWLYFELKNCTIEIPILLWAAAAIGLVGSFSYTALENTRSQIDVIRIGKSLKLREGEMEMNMFMNNNKINDNFGPLRVQTLEQQQGLAFGSM